MSYVIYNTRTKKRHETAKRHASFGTKRTAKGILTKAINKGEFKDPSEWVVASYEEWQAADHMIEVISAQDGKTVCKILASDKGSCVDPSMDVYWQM